MFPPHLCGCFLLLWTDQSGSEHAISDVLYDDRAAHYLIPAIHTLNPLYCLHYSHGDHVRFRLWTVDFGRCVLTVQETV